MGSDKYKRDPRSHAQTEGELSARASEASIATKPPPSPQPYGNIDGGKLRRMARALRMRTSGACQKQCTNDQRHVWRVLFRVPDQAARRTRSRNTRCDALVPSRRRSSSHSSPVGKGGHYLERQGAHRVVPERTTPRTCHGGPLIERRDHIDARRRGSSHQRRPYKRSAQALHAANGVFHRCKRAHRRAAARFASSPLILLSLLQGPTSLRCERRPGKEGPPIRTRTDRPPTVPQDRAPIVQEILPRAAIAFSQCHVDGDARTPAGATRNDERGNCAMTRWKGAPALAVGEEISRR